MALDGLDRPPLDPHGPGRQLLGQHFHPVGAAAPDEEDSFPGQVTRIVEAAGVSESEGTVEAELSRDPLPLGEWRRLPVEAHLNEPTNGATILTDSDPLGLAEQTGPLRRPANRLRK